MFCENGCFGCLWPGGLYALRASGLGIVLQSFDLAPVAPFVIVFCSRGLNGNGLEFEFATASLFGLAMTGRGGLLDPAESEEVEPGSGKDGGRNGRLCGGGSMFARWSQLCCCVECCSNVVGLSPRCCPVERMFDQSHAPQLKLLAIIRANFYGLLYLVLTDVDR